MFVDVGEERANFYTTFDGLAFEGEVRVVNAG